MNYPPSPKHDELARGFFASAPFRLTRQEEVELASRYRRIRQTLRASSGNDRGRQLSAQATTIRERFIGANLGLVVWLAHQYAYGEQSMPDLVQEGTLGLIQAIEKFDPERGFRFSTYAAWWIRQAVQRAAANQERTIHAPQRMLGLRRKAIAAHAALTDELGEVPTPAELAARLGQPQRRVERALAIEPQPRRLDGPRAAWMDPEGVALGDTIEADIGAADEELIQREQTRRLRELLATLEPSEANVLKLRYGLGASRDETCTLQQIGDELGVTRERARQIATKALEKLRQAVRRAG